MLNYEYNATKQKTLQNSIKAKGIGVHSGEVVSLELIPAPVDTGVIFQVVDISSPQSPTITEIPAQAKYVSDTMLSTTIAKDGSKVSTVEHLLSALAGLGIDNAYIKLTSKLGKSVEVPIMDGSSDTFGFSIKAAGIKVQDEPKRFLRINKTIESRDQDKWAKLEPYNGFKLEFELDYDHPVLKQSGQYAEFDFSKHSYTKELSRARTFGFISDYEWLKSKNLALGASLKNAVALNKHKVMNEGGLRYKDEFVRHKILDAIGDLYLFGNTVLGKFSAYKAGHTLNNAVMCKLLEDTSAWDIVSFVEPEKASALNSAKVKSSSAKLIKTVSNKGKDYIIKNLNDLGNSIMLPAFG